MKEKIKDLLQVTETKEVRKYTYEEIAEMVGCSKQYVYLVSRKLADEQ